MKISVPVGRRQIDVNWGLADRLIAWISPAAGLQRLQGRVLMNAATGGYVGGKRDRRGTRNWRPSETSANEDISPDLPDLRARSRDLVRNTPLATGAISTVTTSVIGDGLVLQAQVDRDYLGLTTDAALAWQKSAQREWEIFCRTPDFTDRQNFDGLQSLILRSVLESGDVLVVRRRRLDPASPYALKLQLIEADRLSNPARRANTPTLVDGVELDADGRPIAYHISSAHPGDVNVLKREWKRYEKGSTVTGQPLILHAFEQLRPDQARGVPYLAPVVEALKQLSDYGDAELKAALVNAMFTVFVKPQSLAETQSTPLVGAAGAGTSADAKTETQIGSGMIVDLAPGEDVSFADPKRPNVAFEAFVGAVSQHIGVALELPRELLLKNFTASYSASRAALEMAWQMFRRRRSWMAWNVCQPVYEWVITEAVATGRLSAPGFFDDPLARQAWLGSDWVGPSRIQLDPLKEANADLVDVNMGAKTIEQVCTERTGGTFDGKHEQRAREQKLRNQAGLVTPTSSSQALQPPPGEQNQSADQGGSEQ